MARLIFLFFFAGVLPTFAFADLLPQQLKLTLKQIKSQSSQYTLLELEIQNVSDLHGSILVPGHPQLGMGLFVVYRYHQTENNQFRLDSTFSLLLKDSANVDEKYMQFWSLAPGESFKQLLRIESISTPNEFFMVQYQPHVCREWFKYAFRWHDEDGESVEPISEDDQRFAYQGAYYSDLLVIDSGVIQEPVKPDFHRYSSLQKAIYTEHWSKVKRKLRHHLPSFSATNSNYPILNTQLYSQAVLSSLPTYFHQYLFVETKSGLFYLSLDYQMGKIFKGRSFLAKIAHLCGARRVFWRTSAVHKNRLKEFKLVPFKVND
ncbi:MAG: hypothetical protein RLZZ65_971 [Bacteroidota bacterium]|jgi:hypothetical protein